MLHNAIRHITRRSRQVVAVQPVQAVTGRATASADTRLYRARDIDGPTVRLPVAGQPGVNTGRYRPQRDMSDRNAMPRTFAGQRVVA